MSPKRGFEGVREASADIEARRGSGGGGWVPEFRLRNPNDTAVVRFLEQDTDVEWAWMHELPIQPNRQYADKTPCLDQDRDGTPCPGCEAGLKRSFKGWINVIWRDAPTWKRDAENRIMKDAQGRWIQDGTADQVMVWAGGISLFEELDAVDGAYKGLTSRDFRITRRGTGFNTRYDVKPVDPDSGPQPMSKNDEKLASEKHDLSQFSRPLDPQDLAVKIQGGEPDRVTADRAGELNPFMERR